MPKLKEQPPVNGGWAIPKEGFATWQPAHGCVIDGETYEEGHFVFREGTVEAYSQGSANYRAATRLTAYYQGKLYNRSYDERYSRRHLKTLARRLLEDVIKEQAL